ncbi:MAG TPA: helix-turn-helix transcriptional regulator [Bacillales bacterium]|nr:helix-turn-helix transcriptional regulator [Bacillales bacterium]
MSHIKKLRESKGWTQSQLALKSRVSQSAISDIESGKRNPSFNVIKKIANALGVSVTELTDDEEQTA